MPIFDGVASRLAQTFLMATCGFGLRESHLPMVPKGSAWAQLCRCHVRCIEVVSGRMIGLSMVLGCANRVPCAIRFAGRMLMSLWRWPRACPMGSRPSTTTHPRLPTAWTRPYGLRGGSCPSIRQVTRGARYVSASVRRVRMPSCCCLARERHQTAWSFCLTQYPRHRQIQP